MARYSLNQWREETLDGYAALWRLIIFLFFAACPLLLAYQGFEWLRLGSWPAITIKVWQAWNGYSPVKVDWVGLQTIIDWVLDLPLWIVCPAIGAALYTISLPFWEAAEQNTQP